MTAPKFVMPGLGPGIHVFTARRFEPAAAPPRQTGWRRECHRKGCGMRRRNWRIVIVGVGLLVLSAAFFLGMFALAPKSNDPVALLRTVGEVSGVVGALSLVMILFGLIGRTS
jgi:hypothetical protein